jgi:phase variant surface lipoprotein P29
MANLSKFSYHTPHFLKRINMKKSLLFVALCAFAGQLAAAEMPAACEEYRKVSYDFIDSMAKQAQAQGKKDFDVAATKKEFEADYASIKKMSKEEQESTCNQGIAEVKELENMLKMMGTIK